MLLFCVCVCALLVDVCQSASLAGWIQSPGFPHGYGSNQSQTLSRCAPPGHAVTLTLLHLDLEESYQCENDVLEISEAGHVLVTLCGQMSAEELQLSVNPLLRSSSGGCLVVSFHSDYSNTKRHTGFKAFYTIQDVDECWENHVVCSHFCHNYIGGYSCSCKPGFNLDEDQHECRASCTEQRYGAGVLTSPGSPGPYSENADCVFSLSVEDGNQLELTFTGVFDLESRDDECVDFVEVKTDTETFGPYCGKKRPDSILTGAQHVTVLFHSDVEGTNYGFSLTYKPKVMECVGKVTHNSVLAPERERYEVGDSITVTCEIGHFLDDFTTTYTSTCQSNGKWNPKHNCEPVNCGSPELPYMMALTEENTETLYQHRISVECSSEYYQLAGNANFICESSGEWVAENGQTFSQHTPQCVPVCGITKETAGGRIFGGKNAQLGQIPWQLLVKEPNRGGASLINDLWAVTAAHVVDGKKTLIFSGGMVDGRDRNRIEIQTEKIIIHPKYKKDIFDNDIALVKMSSRVPLGENILPVCLPKTKTHGPVMEGKSGTISGFGATSEKRARSQYLQYAPVKEYTGLCFESNITATENMFCAGGEQGVDSCKGDSGGPLFVPMLGFGSSELPYQLKGIVSWGPPECGDKQFKGYYTKVENYLKWIRETMETN